MPQSCPPDNELKDSWNKLSVSLQWSNLYSAYSISPKLRSIGITDGYVKLDNDQITLLAEVEHNRWNMEKLLLGFRKPTADNLWQQGNGRHLQKETLCASRYTSVWWIEGKLKSVWQMYHSRHSASRKQQHIGSNQHYIMKTYHVFIASSLSFQKERDLMEKSWRKETTANSIL